jgi:hypothetical protein
LFVNGARQDKIDEAVLALLFLTVTTTGERGKASIGTPSAGSATRA